MEVKKQRFQLSVEVDVYDDTDGGIGAEVLEHYVKDLLDRGDLIKTVKVEAYEK